MRALLISILVAGVLGLAGGCSRPFAGRTLYHDMSKVIRDMTPNEVRSVMGSDYKLIYEAGIMGMDGGNYVWEYPEGRVYFHMDNVTRVAPEQ